MAKRKSITQKVRFEIFKRDSFRCQYCGNSAPDVILNVDHIKPVADGGDNELTNLITSCFDCNQGKKARLLDDKSVIQKQKQQLDDLNERRIQLEMMLQWREGLSKLQDDKHNAIVNHWEKITESFTPNDSGQDSIREWIRKFELINILDAMDISLSQYGIRDSNGDFSKESIEKVFNYIPKIAKNKQKDEKKPYMKDLYYMRGILKNRLNYYHPHKCIILLERAHLKGVSIEDLKGYCAEVRNWSHFSQGIENFLDGERDEDE